MAGTFYSAEEAAEKLNKTQKELKEMVKEGKLREFRDGSNLLFKAEEVDSLVDEVDIVALDDTIAPEEVPSNKAQDEQIEEPAPIEEEAALEALEPVESQEKAESQEPVEPLEQTDELLSEQGSEVPVLDDLTDADTAITGQGTSVLGQTDKEYPTTDDTMAETALSAAGGEGSKEDIEGDVSLDSFGSGSGLLDLSLQADDTSLGGILDEIYTPEGEGGEQAKEKIESEGTEEAETTAEPAGEITEEAEQMLPEEQPAAQAQLGVEALVAPIMEAMPDKQSNILGMLLFLPLIAVIYSMIVVVAGSRGIRPSILTAIQDYIWYLFGCAIAVTFITAGASVVMTRERKPRVKKEKPPKPPKVKKEKPPKVKKEKKK
jgi:excisionase family DNA binding protein